MTGQMAVRAAMCATIAEAIAGFRPEEERAAK